MPSITTKIISDKNLSKKEMDLMNKWRKSEFGENEVKNFKKDYFPGAKFFFVKDGKEIVAFGGLRDIPIDYLGKKYKILGICNIIAIKKGKGYGRILISAMVDFLKRTGKTGLGFTGKTEFFKKSGLKTKELFGKRFALMDPKTGEIKFEEKGDEGDGIYLDGKDSFIKKVLSTKQIVYYSIPGIAMPHW